MNNTFLEKIRPSVLERVTEIKEKSSHTNQRPDFLSVFKKNKTAIISEIKYASPSKGKIYHGRLNAAEIAKQYIEAGACALSILAEPLFFEGNIDYIRSVNQVFPEANILLKDFVLSREQILQGYNSGANAVLLIRAFLSQAQINDLYNYAVSLGMTPLIEIHSLAELTSVLPLNPPIVGVNNRNLRTLEIDLDIARSLITHIPSEIIAVCESGISTKAQMTEMQQLGYRGFLIGSLFMAHSNPGHELKLFLEGNLDEN